MAQIKNCIFLKLIHLTLFIMHFKNLNKKILKKSPTQRKKAFKNYSLFIKIFDLLKRIQI